MASPQGFGPHGCNSQQTFEWSSDPEQSQGSRQKQNKWEDVRALAERDSRRRCHGNQKQSPGSVFARKNQRKIAFVARFLSHIGRRLTTLDRGSRNRLCRHEDLRMNIYCHQYHPAM